jgi:alpha-L-fucosidase 2
MLADERPAYCIGVARKTAALLVTCSLMASATSVPILLLATPLKSFAEPYLSSDAQLETAVSRSDIFVGQPNILPSQAMPLGNGRLGVAIWAANGMTIQLNRGDTLPGRLSPGQVVFSGLKPMVADKRFRGRLALFGGIWRQVGAGMSAQVVVDQDSDRVIVDGAGANPATQQDVILKLWKPRSPTASVHDNLAILADHWLDNKQPGASGLPFGSLAAVRVVGRNITTRRIDERTVAVRFRPMADGRYRVIIAAPSFNGRVDPVEAALKTLNAPVDLDAPRRWWNDFWRRACLITASSEDGRASYFESLRMLYLFASAAHNGGTMPGSQAGVADLFSSVKDLHFWDPAAYWEWNLRMQIAANLSAGVPALNEPFFALYRNNLAPIRRWTLEKMVGRDGICIPETMRFNGVGVEYESADLRAFPIITHSCDSSWSSTSNARTLTTGAEVGLWVWETYLKTGDRRFLQANYTLMAEAARFMLAYQQLGGDGLLHTYPSNAHETQLDVVDPTTDLSAIRTLYPATIEAARELARDDDLAAKLAAALDKTPELPLEEATGVPDGSLPASAQAPGLIIAASHDLRAPLVNSENIGLEPVWPYSLIGPDSPLFGIALRTYAYRPFRSMNTWSSDPIDAARLGLGAELSQSLYALTQLYQIYPNGMADWGGGHGEFYLEQMAVVAAAMGEALAQDQSDGLRIGPAIPPNWTMNGTVYVRGNARVTVEVSEGEVTRFELKAGSAHQFKIVNPWPNRQVGRFTAGDAAELAHVANNMITLDAEPGQTYGFRPWGATRTSDPVDWSKPPSAPKSLGRALIGLGEPCRAAPDGYDPATDTIAFDLSASRANNITMAKQMRSTR